MALRWDEVGVGDDLWIDRRLDLADAENGALKSEVVEDPGDQKFLVEGRPLCRGEHFELLQ